MLQLILGRSGSGKTEFVRNEITQLALKGKTGMVLIVPDQFSFESERAILNKVGPAVASKIEVLTFSRLAEEIFRTYGGITEKRIDDSGRTLLMAMAVAACEDQLTLLGAAAKSDKITGLMLKAVEEFKACGITPEELFAICEKTTGALKQKTYELALVFAAFEAMLKNTFVESSDLVTRLGDILLKQDFFKDKTVFIDAFEGFNRQKLRVLQSVLKDSEKVYCTLCCDDLYGDDETSIFAPIRNIGRALISLTREIGVKVLSPVILNKPYRFKCETIKELEAKLFRAGKIDSIDNSENISIFEASDVYEEIEYVAATIRNLVIDGYRYEDISVVCRNSQKYHFIIENVFEKWEIPAFIAKPKAVDLARLMRLVLSAFTVLEYGYRTEDILTMLKTGLCGLSGRELSMLENYIYVWNISGKDWKNPFIKSPGGFGEIIDKEALLEIENMRIKIISPLIKFSESTVNATGREISAAVYELLTNFESDKAVLQNSTKLTENGQEELAAEEIRFWKTLMEILDRFAIIIGEQTITRTRYRELLREVLAKEEIMDIPLKHDSVVFGTANQIKQESPKITFLIGAVQGEFPMSPTESGVFSDSERKALVSMKLPLEGELENDALIERFYTYNAASAASEKLFISYHLTSGGENIAPSELVNRVLAIFTTLKITKKLPKSYFANSKEAAFSALSATYRENTSEALSFKELFSDIEEFNGRLDSIKRITEKTQFEMKDKDLSHDMFKDNYFSPSQVDTYHRCKFQYFCKYGLGAKERKLAEINVLEYGTLMHYLFEKVFSGDFASFTDEEEISAKLFQLIISYANERMGGFEQMSARDKYRFKRMADTALILVLQVIEELAQSKFKPEYFELMLSDKGTFPPLRVKTKYRTDVIVGGVIDRVDIYDSPKGRYVRVVDYKTGNKEFKLTDVLYGLSLQMLIYLAALSETGFLPAGVLYMPAAFPEISAEKGISNEKLQAKRNEKLCMKGIILDDKQIILAMEEAARGKYIPVAIKPNGKYTNEKNVLSTEDLSTVFSHVKSLIATMAEELMDGRIEAAPLMVGNNSCAWCPFGSVCSETKEDTTELKLNKAEILEKMKDLGELHVQQNLD